MRIARNFVGVHHCTRHLNRAHKIEVVIALVVGKLLHLRLSKCRRVLHNVILDGECSSHSRLVGDHIEVIRIIPLIFNQTAVHHGARSWVQVLVISSFCESGVDLLVNQHIQNFGLVSGLKVTN